MPPLSHAPQVAVAQPGDVDELAALRRAEGWIANDWLLRLLGACPHAAVFTLRAIATGPILGTICATAYGAPSVIGNVIVRPEGRGRGYGKLLMAAALEWIKAQGARAVTLDATTAGQPLYRQFGFVPMYHTWEVWQPLATLQLDEPLAGEPPATPGWQIAPLASDTPDALDALAALDRDAFGGDRMGLLAAMLPLPGVAAIAARDATTGAVAGYLFTRPLEPPRAGVYVGPFVARAPDAARALLLAAVRRARATSSPAAYLCLGIPGDSDSPAVQLARALGIAVHRDDLRMRLDLASEGSGPSGVADAPDMPNAPNAPDMPEDGRPAWRYGMLSAMVG